MRSECKVRCQKDELHHTALVYMGETLSEALLLLMLVDECLVTLTEALYSSVVVLC